MSAADNPAQYPAANQPPPLPIADRRGKSHEGMAVASLICALFGLFLVSPILGTIAIVLGVIARKNMRASKNFEGRGPALAGIIIG